MSLHSLWGPDCGTGAEEIRRAGPCSWVGDKNFNKIIVLTEAHTMVARSPGEAHEDPADVGRGPERQSAVNQAEREKRVETAREGHAQDRGGRGHGGHGSWPE